MNIVRALRDAISYVYEGVTGLFSPNRDEYPNTGVQPFSGDPYSKWVSSDQQKK